MTRRNPFLTWLDDRPTWLTITLSFLLLLGIWHLLVVWGDYPRLSCPAQPTSARRLSDWRVMAASCATPSSL